MFRMFALGAFVAVASIATAPAAHADPICQTAVLTGVVTQTFVSCLPYGDDVTCNVLTVPTTPQKVVLQNCVPSLVAQA